MKAAFFALAALALPFTAHAAKDSYLCPQVKPQFGPADKVMILTRLSHGAIPDGMDVRYALQVTMNGEVRLAELAIAKQNPAEVAFKVRGKQVAGFIPLEKEGESTLKIGRQAYRFICRVKN
ncbi:MAG: hypothetical protein EOP11_02715 [Proteobacteria bacterium]|nr:MAG: hypothetical protein EOP11_02715 [Pseudomonadota bacterium]